MDVLKASGVTEEFSHDKLKASVMKAGASDGHAERVARNVEIRVRNSGKTDTDQIREWVIIELMSIPAYNVAEDYSSFRHQKMTPVTR